MARWCTFLAIAFYVTVLPLFYTQFQLGYPLPSKEYQAFLDKFPVDSFTLGIGTNFEYGWTLAVRLPRLLDAFDWHVHYKVMPYVPRSLQWVSERSRGTDPRAVLSGHHALPEVLAAAQGLSTNRSGRALVLMGMSGTTSVCLGDNASAKAATIAALQRHFDAVFCIGNDVGLEGVRTMPKGLVEHKLRSTRADLAVVAITSARLDGVAKPKSVLAAFGRHTLIVDGSGGPLGDLSRVGHIPNTTAAILSYTALPWYSTRHSGSIFAPPHVAGQVPKALSRIQASRWLLTEAARQAGVEARSVEPHAWWAELASYRFMLAPMGDEIQTPKTTEALLVLTVPIVQRGPYRVYDDLLRLGFPLATVDEWHEISPARLSDWWRELAPRLASFRANCLTTDAYWRIIIGQADACH